MNQWWIIGNAVTIISGIVCMAYLTHVLRSADASKRPPAISAAIIGVTGLVSGLQFVLPNIVAALQRDAIALQSGEVWRLITPILVQPVGLIQCAVNFALALIFLPPAERLYGRGLLALYLGAGVAGQIANYVWASANTGGSSTAIFGAIGGVLAYTLRRRRDLRLPFVIIGVVGALGGIALTVLRDGHGAGLIVGSLIGLAWPAAPIEPSGGAGRAR